MLSGNTACAPAYKQSPDRHAVIPNILMILSMAYNTVKVPFFVNHFPNAFE